MIDRVNINAPNGPHFIGCWNMENTALCDEMIQVFESRKSVHRPGISGDGSINDKIKRSMDMTFSPRDLEEPSLAPLNTYMDFLSECFLDYLEQWPFLKSILTTVHIGPFNIQRYDAGGHYAGTHSERVSLENLHRVLVWMTYLNDVEEGGATRFPHYDLDVRPQRGKTIIWPAEWTHAHSGGMISSGQKYIITGWMHFPDVEPTCPANDTDAKKSPGHG